MKVIREKQPKGNEGVAYSLRQVARLGTEGRLNPKVVAFSRRACRDDGVLGQVDGQDSIKVARAIWKAIKKQGIGWLPDPDKAELLAAAQHFMPSAEGADDAELVAGDCDELTLLFVALFLAAIGSVGVPHETCAIIGHSYSQSRQVGHVLAGVHDGRGWVRVDLSGDWDFGGFKKPEWEVFLSVPSGKTICSAESCSTARPIPWMGGEIDHVRLEGLLPRPGRVEWCGQLGRLGASEANPQATGAEEEFGKLLDAQRWNLLTVRQEALEAHGSLLATAEKLKLSGEDLAALGWTPEDESQLDNAQQSAEYLAGLFADVLSGKRQWGFTEDGKDFAIAQLPDDEVRIGSDNLSLFSLGPLDAPPEAPTTGTLGAIPPPVAAGIVVGLGIASLGIAYFAIVELLRTLRTIAETAEQRAINEAWAKCAETNDPDKCANLVKAVGQSQSTVQNAKAERDKIDADRQKEQNNTLIILGTLATVLVVGGVGTAIAYEAGAFKGLFGKKQAAA